MQTIAVFATILAAASAATIINSQRLGGSFAYSTSELAQLGLISSPVVSNVVSPLGYSAISGVPVSGLSLNGVNLVSESGVPVSQLGNVALVRSSDGALISGVQNVVVPATSTVVSNVGTPASTAKVSQVNTPITLSSVGLSSVGVLPVSSLGSVVVAKK